MIPKTLTAVAPDELDRARRLEDDFRELARVVRRLGHDVANSLVVPLGVLELLRDHPGLDEGERRQVDLAIARLTALAAEVRALHAEALRLDPAEAARQEPEWPDPSD